jgi:hypothetical protein
MHPITPDPGEILGKNILPHQRRLAVIYPFPPQLGCLPWRFSSELPCRYGLPEGAECTTTHNKMFPSICLYLPQSAKYHFPQGVELVQIAAD